MRGPALSFSLLLLAAGCAPAPAPVVITPALLDSAPRYRMVLIAPQGGKPDQVIREFSAQVERVLAERGMVAAAEWETPTLQVTVAARWVSVTNTPGTNFNVRYGGSCAGSNWDAGHCTPLDMAPLTPASGYSTDALALGLQVRDLGTGRVLVQRPIGEVMSKGGVPAEVARVNVLQALGTFGR